MKEASKAAREAATAILDIEITPIVADHRTEAAMREAWIKWAAAIIDRAIQEAVKPLVEAVRDISDIEAYGDHARDIQTLEACKYRAKEAIRQHEEGV